jgi:hypothetical protein
MEREQFSKFRHEAVHELKDLNDLCEKEYRISSWPNWEYDLARGTLAFTQVVGTTFPAGGGVGDGQMKA